ncbi:MAG: IreB family regulatory phosphoprotein [Bacillota bacterium]
MTPQDEERTRIFITEEEAQKDKARRILASVYTALMEQGYDAVEQLVGYLLSGDPTYITESGGARQAVQRVERNELLQELVHFYVRGKE